MTSSSPPRRSPTERRRRRDGGVVTLLGLTLVAGACKSTPPASAPAAAPASQRVRRASGAPLALPRPGDQTGAPGSLRRTLQARRTWREFGSGALSRRQVSELLWAAQGITEPRRGLRTAPSAGALYPLELLLVTGEVEGLAAGVYRYLPRSHELRRVITGDKRGPVAASAVGQLWIQRAAALLVITGVQQRTARKYGARARRYVAMEAGAAAQNAMLQATQLGLAVGVVGAFDDAQLRRLLALQPGEAPLLLLPVGRRKGR